jgi:hypothetical protein
MFKTNVNMKKTVLILFLACFSSIALSQQKLT